jgi:O-antigen ligase/tetratricopeptide (TPR) repeat protein
MAEQLLIWPTASALLMLPLFLGGKLPWALACFEAAIFGLAAVSSVVRAFTKRHDYSRFACKCALPLGLFCGLLLFQLLALPGWAVKTLSPGEYHLYAITFADRHDAAAEDQSDQFTKSPIRHVAGQSIVTDLGKHRPTSLSLAPSQTFHGLIELAAYATLFWLVMDISGSQLAHAQDILITAAVLSGLLVATLAIIEFFNWNGRILWLFVPYDWGAPQPGVLPRALGPFVNPDHLGNYLAIILPVALGGIAYDYELFDDSAGRLFRCLCVTTVLLSLSALLLSLSRGAWIASTLAIAFTLLIGCGKASRPLDSVASHTKHGLRYLLLGTAMAIVLALAVIGPRGRQQVDVRLGYTMTKETGLGQRLVLATDTLPMVRDFPFFGVGLGAWPELFPHYSRPPWSNVFYRETHNDYVQLLAETGLTGFALAAWIAALVVRQLRANLFSRDRQHWFLLVALCGGLIAMAFHEAFDFSLRMPANALVIVLFLVLALRIGDDRIEMGVWRSRAISVAIASLTVPLTVIALLHDNIPYPDCSPRPKTIAEAEAAIAAYPANSRLRFSLAELDGDGLSDQRRLAQLRAGVWLDPNDPYGRDAYASQLLETGHRDQALGQMVRSLEWSPSLSTHYYLDSSLIPWLSADERIAVETGLRQAVALRYESALSQLAEFYLLNDQNDLAAKAYLQAAANEDDDAQRVGDMLAAAHAGVLAGDRLAAEKVFRNALSATPGDERIYQEYIECLLVPAGRTADAWKLIEAATLAGLDPVPLYCAIAEAAEALGRHGEAADALAKAWPLTPSFSITFRLGQIYMEQGRYDRAALMMQQATQKMPASAEAFYNLGLAEEATYQFSNADRSFQQALELAPGNRDYRTHYDEFRKQLAASEKTVRQAE